MRSTYCPQSSKRNHPMMRNYELIQICVVNFDSPCLRFMVKSSIIVDNVEVIQGYTKYWNCFFTGYQNKDRLQKKPNKKDV